MGILKVKFLVLVAIWAHFSLAEMVFGRSFVPNSEERLVTPGVQSLPEWKSKVIVADGEVNSDLVETVGIPSELGKIHISQLRWLLVRNFQVDGSRIQSARIGISAPFYLTVYFQEKGEYESLTQGRIEVSGLIFLNLYKPEDPIKITLSGYDDSGFWDAMKRNMGVTEKFDEEFLESFLLPLLHSVLKDTNSIKTRLELLRADSVSYLGVPNEANLNMEQVF